MQIIAEDQTKYVAALDGDTLVLQTALPQGGAIASTTLDLIAADSEKDYLEAIAETKGWPDLPEIGEQVVGGQVYVHNGKHVLARQDHIRTHHAPDDPGMLALFVVWRENADDVLEWVSGEQLEKGALRTWAGKTWRAIQNPGVNIWEPGSKGTEAIWAEYVKAPPLVEEWPQWVQPTGGHDAYRLGAKVKHNGRRWINTGSDTNVWEPGVFGWEDQL